MNIKGNTVVLRALSPQDAPLLLEIINDPDTESMLGGKSFPVSLEDQERWIGAQGHDPDTLRCMIDTAEGESVGTIILTDIDRSNGTAEVHIKLSPSNGRGKGYGTDALKTLTRYGFEELRLNCIYAEVMEYNTASCRLFEKCGFSKEGILRKRIFKAGKFHDLVSYSLCRTDDEA